MYAVRRFIRTVLKAWHLWCLRKKLRLVAAEMEYGRRLAEHAEPLAHQLRAEIAMIERPPTVYDCSMRRTA